MSYENAYKTWYINEDKRLLSELEQNLSIADIAKNHKRSFGAIKRRINKIAYDMCKDGKSIKKIIRRTNLSYPQVSKIAKNCEKTAGFSTLSKKVKLFYEVIYKQNQEGKKKYCYACKNFR